MKKPAWIPPDQIRVATPCTEDWAGMTGDEKSRFCNQCQLNVYNLSEMTESHAVELIQQKEGQLCVRYYLREDGTMLTRDCPVGIKALRRKAVKAAGFVLAMVIGGLTSLGIYVQAAEHQEAKEPCPVQTPSGSENQPDPNWVMGEMTLPEEQPGSQPQPQSPPSDPRSDGPQPVIMGKVVAPPGKPVQR